MARSSDDDIYLRMGLDEGDVLADMRKIETQSHRMLEQMAKDGKEATTEFKKLKVETDELSDGIKKLESAHSGAVQVSADLSERLKGMGLDMETASGKAGPLGKLIAAIGPEALGASLGIGALGSAVVGLLWQVEATADRMFEYAKQAKSGGFSVEDLRALELQFLRNGFTLDDFSSVAQRFQSRIAEATNAQGEFYEALKETHPELIEQVMAAESQSEALVILGQALANETDRVERNRMAKAALDDAGVALQGTLMELADKGLGAVRDEAREAGVAITDELITAYQQLEQENAELAMSFEVQWALALNSFAGGLKEAKSLFTEFLAEFNQMDALSSRQYSILSDERLDRHYENLRARLADAEAKMATLSDGRRATWQDSMRDVYEDMRLVEEERARRYGVTNQDRSGGEIVENRDLPEPEDTLTDRERLRIEKEVAQILLQQGDYQRALAIEKERILKAAKESGLTETQINKALEQAEQALIRQTPQYQEQVKLEQERQALVSKAANLLLQQNDISLALAQSKREIQKLEEAGIITSEQAGQAISDAEETLRKKTPEYKKQLELNKMLEDTLKAIDKIDEKHAKTLEKNTREREKELAAVVQLQQQHAYDLARARGDRGALSELSVQARADAYQNADSTMTRDDAERRARAEIEALNKAEVQGEIADTFGRGLVAAAGDGDWQRVFMERLRDAANNALYDAGVNLVNLLFKELSGLNLGGSGGISAAISSILGGSDIFGLSSLFSGGADAAVHSGVANVVRHHSGHDGAGPSEYLALLQRGETVSRRDQSRSSGGAYEFNFHAPNGNAEEIATLRQQVVALYAALTGLQEGFEGNVRGVVSNMHSTGMI